MSVEEELAHWVELKEAWEASEHGRGEMAALSGGALAYFGRYAHSLFVKHKPAELQAPATPADGGSGRWEAWEETLRFLVQPRKVSRAVRMNWILDHAFAGPDAKDPLAVLKQLKGGLKSVMRQIVAEAVREAPVMKGKTEVTRLDAPLGGGDDGGCERTGHDVHGSGYCVVGTVETMEFARLGREIAEAHFHEVETVARIALVAMGRGVPLNDERVTAAAGCGKTKLYKDLKTLGREIVRWVAAAAGPGEDASALRSIEVCATRALTEMSEEALAAEPGLRALFNPGSEPEAMAR